MTELDKLRQLSDEELFDRLVNLIALTSYASYHYHVCLKEEDIREQFSGLLKECSSDFNWRPVSNGLNN